MDPAWRFHLGELTSSERADQDPLMATYFESMTGFAQGPASLTYDDRSWRVVNLPHDWAVEGHFDMANNMAHGYLPSGVGWYRKTFTLPTGDAQKRLYVEFDGVFRNCTVWLNGYHLGNHTSGYTSFRFDVTDVALYGATNVLAVRVDATKFEGWWYEGAGIYRHVWLVKVDPLHVAPWGTCVQTHLDESHQSSEVVVETTVLNSFGEPKNTRLETSIVDAQGNTVTAVRTSKKLAGDSQTVITQHLKIQQPQLWSVDQPNLYRAVTVVKSGKQVLDTYETTFGVRTIRFDAQTGFHLNGQPLKIKGTCNHQDHAGVGVALPDHLFEYRIQRLKEMGCNAYRCAHNPPAPELLDACDRLGMLVMDETRHLDSTPEGLAQLKSILMRDRNHPSIILWSMGNEERIQGTEPGARIVATMKRLVRRLDPTRSITLAMNGEWGSRASHELDVMGCNYYIQNYDDFHNSFPAQPVVATENGSTVSTRGEYETDPQRGYVSAYDVNHPEWAFTALDSWKAVAERPYMAGTFVWTGFDYRGEPTPYQWPCINSHFGILDTCGFPKDNFYYYQAWWSDRTVLHIFPHWNWPGKEGQPIDVWVHSNCQAVELYINGASLGRKDVPRNGHLVWQVPYVPGTLLARGYRNGMEVQVAELKTTGVPAALRLEADRTSMAADGADVTVVNVAVVDDTGSVVPTAGNLVYFGVSAGATILGVGNGDPSSHESDKAVQRSTFHGLCQVIVQAGLTPGTLTLVAESEGLSAARLSMAIIPAPPHLVVDSL
jgi:beta-galactosidase